MKLAPCVLFLAACGGADPGGIPAGQRLLTGRVSVQSSSTDRHALQVVAVWAAPDCATAGGIKVGDAAAGVSACAIFGDPFDPGQRGGGVEPEPFRLLIPCDLTVNLLVQTVASSDAHTPGGLLALFVFATGTPSPGPQTTTLLARDPMCRNTPRLASNLIDIGAIDVPASPPPAGPMTIVLGGPAGGINPLATVDTNGDGVPNLSDPDDDADGTPDANDADPDGDGIPDAAELFAPSWFTP